MRLVWLQVAALLVVAGAAVAFGFWWAPLVAGAGIGIVVDRARWAIPAGAGIGLLAWLAPLAVDQVRYGIGASASALAAIMGFGHQGAFPLVLTLLVGTLLGLCGAWLAGAARTLIGPALR